MTELTRRFQHYEVLQRADGSAWELGRGAMGITYKAFDVNLCCDVALKVVVSALLDHPSARERFVREARAAAALRHRNVASVYHLGNDGEHFFYAMEFIDGETLDALVRRQGPLSAHATLRVILQVAKALVAAERQQLVHRDIKPTNVMIVHEDADEEMTVKVIDFGLARPVTGSDDHTSSLTIGGFVGTPQYASPEQLEEEGLDARSDIYSLGVTAWYLLTGQPPFVGSLATVCQQQVHKPPPWQLLPANLPGCVRDLLGRMLEKKPADRPQNARELRAEIEDCLNQVPPDERPFAAAFVTDIGQSTVQGPTNSLTSHSTVPPPETVANDRYRLIRLAQELPGSRVYQACDEADGRQPVTIRTLPPHIAQAADFAEDIRLVLAAPHPRLVHIFSEEKGAGTFPAFLVEEALVGFSLRDLLAARKGTLPVAEALRLLSQAADAASHAAGRSLDHLDLALHHVQIHFPFAERQADGTTTVGALLTLPVERWPHWTLKVHPFSTEWHAPELKTWAGEMTLIPHGDSPHLPVDPATASANNYPRLLAGLAYELLGGSPLTKGTAAPGRTGYNALPSLNERANTILSQALTDPSAFQNCGEFFEALDSALTSEKGSARSGSFSAAPTATPGTEFRPSTVPPPPTVGLEASVRPLSIPPLPRRPATVPPTVGGSTVSGTDTGSVAELFEEDLFRSEVAGAVGEGSVWDRLAMNHGEPARPGRWIFAMVTVAVVFVGVFAAVLAMLLHAPPARPVRSMGGSKLPLVATPPPPTVRPTLRDVAPTPSVPRSEPVPSPTPPLPTVVPVPSPPVIAVAPLPPPSPVPEESAPPAAPVPEPMIALHLDSVPPGAEVRLEGRMLGITPLDTTLRSGDHELVASYKGIATHKTIRLNPDQPRANEKIMLMRPDLVPSNVLTSSPTARPPRANPLAERRPNERPPGRVEPALPVGPPSRETPVPVRRPRPLQPFEADRADNPVRRNAVPASPAPDDEDE